MIVFYWDQPFQVCWVVSCSIGKKPFSVGLVAQLFQPASNWVETVEKALVAAAVVFAGPKNCYLHVTCVISPRTGRLHGSLVMTIPRSDRVSTENGWKSVLLDHSCLACAHRIPTHLGKLLLSSREDRMSYQYYRSEILFVFSQINPTLNLWLETHDYQFTYRGRAIPDLKPRADLHDTKCLARRAGKVERTCIVAI